MEFISALEELPSPATNVMSQWSLNAILCLELIGEPIKLELA
ncbi:hypothetical protein [Paenibacillus cremeus]|nr:hypothetical protein [Paenibacillus cremeus]